MIYITGDIHGNPNRIIRFSHRMNLSANDAIVILGDVGCNYFLDERDSAVKKALSDISPVIVCIHGNHECRPQNIMTYERTIWGGASVMYEKEYPGIIFPEDGEIINLEGTKCLVIGGAYSVDRNLRILMNYGWWADEQPDEKTKKKVESVIESDSFDCILSHTCPFMYRPTEAMITGFDNEEIDESTEIWLDDIESGSRYKAWYCGHWHINKKIDRMHFLYDGFEVLCRCGKDSADENKL